MDDKKTESILHLVKDERLMQLTDSICHNWEVVADRLLQIEEERSRGLNYDDGVEVIPLFCRMERVYSQLFSLVGIPQAVLLPSVMQRLGQLLNDNRMDREAVRLIEPENQQPVIVPASIWERLYNMEDSQRGQQEVAQLYAKHILPHLDNEQMMETMQTLGRKDKEYSPTLLEESALVADLQTLGRNVHQWSQQSRQTMGVGLIAGHIWMKSVCQQLDIQHMDGEQLSDKFEEAKQELLSSDEWKEYWDGHLTHLQMNGKLADELKQDAAEVEAWLKDCHHYLYNKWNESPQAFGEALKAERLDDEQMLLLLFHLAKKDMLFRESAPAQERRSKMETNVLETVMRLHELADDRFYQQYELLWGAIVGSRHTSALLMDCNSSKYNNGFSMICLCKIVGYLHREYHLFGNHSPEDMGKFLGDKYSRETFSNYIKKKQSMLTSLSLKEIDAAVRACDQSAAR